MDAKQISVLPDDVPVGLTPIYRTSAVNEPVQLYEGLVEIEQSAKKCFGTGAVRFEWLPRPAVRFEVTVSPVERRGLKLEPCRLHLEGRKWHADAFLQEISNLFGPADSAVAGVVNNFEIGRDQKVSHVMFHVANFTDYLGRAVRNAEGRKCWRGRSVMESKDWRITLDKIEMEKEELEELQAVGGFAITHVGKLERSDGKRFAASKTETVFEALFRHLSFCRGAWVAPILPIGFDASGDRIWEQWRGWKIEHWRGGQNWFNSHSEEGLSKGFPGFLARWADEKWKESLLLANHWYVEANMCAGGVEGSIVLRRQGLNCSAGRTSWRTGAH